MFNNNVYMILEKNFENIDKFKKEMLDSKDNEAEVKMCQDFIKMYTDITNSVIVGHNPIFKI